jgi:hypothetical protein
VYRVAARSAADENIPAEAIYAESMNYVGSEFGLPVQQELQTTIPYTNPVDIEMSGQYIMELSVNINSQINSLPTSSNVINMTSELLSLLTDTTAFYTGSYEMTKTEIMNWESSVMNSSLFTESEKNTLLASGSILRYSLLYWLEYDNTYLQGGRVLRGGFLRWLGWALVGAADAIGGFIGFEVAGPVGAVAIGAAGSGLGFGIFRGRGWEPW